MGRKLLAAGQLAEALSHYHSAVGERARVLGSPFPVGAFPWDGVGVRGSGCGAGRAEVGVGGRGAGRGRDSADALPPQRATPRTT